MARLQAWIKQARDAAQSISASYSSGGFSGVWATLRAGDPARRLHLLRSVLIALLVLQGLRVALPAARAEWLLRAAAAEAPAKDREKFREPLDKFNAILEKGVLGVPPREAPPQLFGVLGNVALIGGAPEQVQELSEGATLPNGEKVVHIGVESVELEKDGQKRTLTVFPDMKGQQQ